ncbi:MAG: M20/M25/M40 family metallo-hydrolase [Chloroflexi bacterium]|nr:M20/M25/M40 family metallo-hydrolase [Chloroflexota bacterium]MCI0776254.1 M20/M25/M40 family metallo-hydrolase [Chloroflexota bacterium]MCI0809382.1 M20/M25/M40 family metallo-hydrolase [Chloroflexota bacterium]MCI0833268.1 M20/M25/M40 family metallo-hydrolase [Chloroflexota bacterium]MCI0835840.1 M20/M25/M40 family metallo-hydrolase [Chloroflexota bacterium]
MPSLQSLLDQVELATNEIVGLERALVQIPSVNTGFMPTGGETAVAEFVRDWLDGEGFSSEILARDPDRGNIISVYPGDDDDTRLMLMSHTDVVPIEDETKWKYEPFAAEIAGGRVYGRGASDCKALLTCQLMAMAVMRRSGVRLAHGLRLVSGADEEHGGRWGFGWLADNHPESLKSQFAVNEGGGIPVVMGNTLTYLLGTGEKGRMELHITLRGESAHASVPWTGVNASYRLSRALSAIEGYRPELDTSLPIFDYIGLFGVEEKPSPLNIDRLVAELNESSPRLGSLLRALSRMVLTPTMVSGGVKSNSVPEEIKLTCDIRTLPFQDEEYVRRQLDQAFEGIDGLEYDIDYMSVPNSSEFETELTEAIKKAQAAAVGRDDIQWVPAISNGFTDSRFTRNLGIITYGFTGAHPDDDPMLTRAHGTDESVGIASLISGTRCMLAIAYDLCGAR